MILKRFMKYGMDFKSYEDFIKNYEIKVPDNFNFGFDVVDEWAKKAPDKRALIWRDEKGGTADFTFQQIMENSNRAANYFKSLGIKKGDPVMLDT